jgi:hypothetical protein
MILTPLALAALTSALVFAPSAKQPAKITPVHPCMKAAGGLPPVQPGIGGRGGVGYGTYQLSARSGMVAAFVASPEFRPWAGEFTGLMPGTTAFADRWQDVAVRDPLGFGDAQRSFVRRELYEPTIMRVENATRYDYNNANDAVREVAFSVAVQHGNAAIILCDALRKTDGDLRKINPRFRREDPDYERRLIDHIYERRAEYVAALRDKELARGEHKKAQQYVNILEYRYPDERSEALRVLEEQ